MGLHRYEDKVILSYTVGNTPILEHPEFTVDTPDLETFVRTLNIGPRDSESGHVRDGTAEQLRPLRSRQE